jgi:outer membrane murein-binding lipoprotein Lpp
VAFFNSTAAELTRRCDQNKNDIEEIYKQGKETNAKVDQLATEVGNLTSRVGGVENKVDTLTTRVSGVENKVDTLTTQVDARFDQVGTRFDLVDKRFDRLERLLTSQSSGVDPSSPRDVLPTGHEQSIRLLESKMNLYSRHTRENSNELERIRQQSLAHQARFDSLDGQMAEVLTILRNKPA